MTCHQRCSSTCLCLRDEQNAWYRRRLLPCGGSDIDAAQLRTSFPPIQMMNSSADHVSHDPQRAGLCSMPACTQDQRQSGIYTHSFPSPRYQPSHSNKMQLTTHSVQVHSLPGSQRLQPEQRHAYTPTQQRCHMNSTSRCIACSCHTVLRPHSTRKCVALYKQAVPAAAECHTSMLRSTAMLTRRMQKYISWYTAGAITTAVASTMQQHLLPLAHATLSHFSADAGGISCMAHTAARAQLQRRRSDATPASPLVDWEPPVEHTLRHCGSYVHRGQHCL